LSYLSIIFSNIKNYNENIKGDIKKVPGHDKPGTIFSTIEVPGLQDSAGYLNGISREKQKVTKN